MGPAAGGTSEWLATRPPARAIPRATTDFFVFLDSAFISGARIMKPEVQKMESEVTNPEIASASSSLFFPNILMNVLAITRVAPDISSNFPNITPKPMMMPMLLRELPNPFVMDAITSS